MVLKYFLITAMICIAAASKSSGQSLTPPQNFFLSAAVNNASAQTVKEQRFIYSGSSYNQYFTKLSSQGHPYYTELKSLFIEYNQVDYRNVTFLYDIFLDEIVVLRPDEKDWVMLDKKLVTEFNLAGHIFQKLDHIEGLEPGFYEMIVNNPGLRLVTKWSKVFRASSWKEQVDYYFVKENAIRVNTKKELLRALADRQNEIKEFIKENRLTFKQNMSADLSKVVRYYSSLVK